VSDVRAVFFCHRLKDDQNHFEMTEKIQSECLKIQAKKQCYGDF